MNVHATVDAFGMSMHDVHAALQKLIESGSPLIKLKNLPIAPIDLPTPSDWRGDCLTLNDNFFIEISSMVGDVYGYADLQDGRLVQEIFPIPRDALKQVGSGAVELKLHTEDPTLGYRADFLGFMCISNIDRIPTVVSVPKFDCLDRNLIDRLSRPVFRILTDRPSDSDKKSQDLITPILFSDDRGRLRFIYDPVYIVREEMDGQDLEAFLALEELVNKSVTNFLLEPGEIGFIDNYQVAHGRPQFTPRYDGTDRWLKRTQISRNLNRFSSRAIIPNKLMP